MTRDATDEQAIGELVNQLKVNTSSAALLPAGIGTPDQYAIGDLSSKFGRLEGEDMTVKYLCSFFVASLRKSRLEFCYTGRSGRAAGRVQRLEPAAVRCHVDRGSQRGAEPGQRRRALDLRRRRLGLLAGRGRRNPRHGLLPPSGRLRLGLRSHGASTLSSSMLLKPVETQPFHG